MRSPAAIEEKNPVATEQVAWLRSPVVIGLVIEKKAPVVTERAA